MRSLETQVRLLIESSPRTVRRRAGSENSTGTADRAADRTVHPLAAVAPVLLTVTLAVKPLPQSLATNEAVDATPPGPPSDGPDQGRTSEGGRAVQCDDVVAARAVASEAVDALAVGGTASSMSFDKIWQRAARRSSTSSPHGVASAPRPLRAPQAKESARRAVKTRLRWRSPVISIRSVHSARTVRTKRSA